jgi:sugar porter (SP) family MFS transporter
MTETSQPVTRTTLLIILAAALGGLVYGHDLGIIGPALLFLGKDIPMDTWHQGFLGGCVFGGGALSTLFSGLLADWLGRKRMMIMAALIFCAGIVMAAAAHSFAMLLSGRLVQGIGVGIITIVTPLYLSESAPAHIRGRAICAFQLVLTLSIMFAYAVGRYFSPTHNWRAMFLSALIPGVLLFIGSLLLPRSPHWLIMKNKLNEAKRVLGKTHEQTAAHREFGSIVNEQLAPKTPLEKMADRRLLLIPLALILLAAILTQLTGINSLLQYGPIVFKKAGMTSHETAITSGTIVTGANFVMTFIALLLVDKIGRRSLLLIGTIGIAIALGFCGAVFLLLPIGHLRGTLFLAGLILFVLSYAIGPGVVVWLVISELLPDRIRSSGMSLALFLNSMTSFLLASFYLKISEMIGFSGLFWACGLFSLAYTVLTLFCIPETKGKSLADISKHFERYKKTTLETAQ